MPRREINNADYNLYKAQVTMQQFEDFGDTRRAYLHGGVNCAGKPCNLP